MTGVEVLAPLRLETRWVAPADRDDGVDEWMLRLRLYPDEFSVRRAPTPPAAAELDRLGEAVAALSADPPLTERDAFATFAAFVGASRAFLLWRTCVQSGPDGTWQVDRSQVQADAHLVVHGPAGLPENLEVWLVHADGTRELKAPLTLDLVAIGADLDFAVFDDEARLVDGELPATWWLSYPRAVDVGLGVDLDVGATPPQLDAVVVVGVGDAEAADLVGSHNAAGRMAVLAPGTPTNTVEGEPTTDLGDDPATRYPMLHVDPKSQQSTRAVLTALTGRVAPTALPMLGGDLDHFGPGALAVQGLWPVLFGRALRDVTGAGAHEVELNRWANQHLAVEGPLPAIRVGTSPYGLLPTSAFTAWVDSPDELAELEARIRHWTLPWRSGAAAAARAANVRVHDADTAGLVRVLGLHAPTRHWRVRPFADLHAIAATRALAGMAPMPATDWDRATAAAWTDRPYPMRPVGPAARGGPVPGRPLDEQEDPDLLRALVTMHPEPLYHRGAEPLGLVGHLFRESLIAGRAVIGEAIVRWQAGDPVELWPALPLDDEERYRDHVMRGDDWAVAELHDNTDENGRLLAARFRFYQEALSVTADLWDRMAPQLFRGTLAALDAAAFRVDPWLTGIANRRLQAMAQAGAPFRLGTYGWVDSPAPYDSAHGAATAPGPTAAGLLHAPSPAQALTAALLRDAAVRHPGEDRWRLTIDSAKVRGSLALAERVRLGVHPYEALGLEVERLAGDWDTVRVLRRHYPLAADQQERRVCDGAQVLAAAREGTLVAGLPADLAERLAPLDDVLDTYGDLLVADGVHALVTGRADLANAAMEAAAGLGPPADLRAMRTPRSATTVHVSAWVLLPPGDGAVDPGAHPADVADPAFAALVAAELGADLRDAEATEAVRRLAAAVGGGEGDAPVPSLAGGTHEGLPASADLDLRAAMTANLSDRLARLTALARSDADALAALDLLDPAAASAVAALAGRWAVDLGGVVPADAAAEAPSPADLGAALGDELADRVTAAGQPAADVNALRSALRSLVGRSHLPVLPVVERSLLPALRAAPELDRTWLELVAAVHPRLAPLEARQLDPGRTRWPSAVGAPGGSTDPWDAVGPVLVAYGPAVPAAAGDGRVAVAALDAWVDSVPSRRHTTAAAFGFNAPKSRAPQAVLLAVPPDPEQRLTTSGLVDVVLETRELAHARAARPTDRQGLPYATPATLVHAAEPVGFLDGWPS